MIDITLWDWGRVAMNGIWLFVGGLAGFLIAAVLCVSADCGPRAEAQQARPDPRVRALEERLAESEAGTRVRAKRPRRFTMTCIVRCLRRLHARRCSATDGQTKRTRCAQITARALPDCDATAQPGRRSVSQSRGAMLRLF